MKSELFTHEMSETSGIFGRKSKVRVVFSGNGAYTDGNNINLPSISSGIDINDKSVNIMRGYTDHEAGHVRHTDFKAVKKFAEEHCTKPDGTRDDFMFGLGNGIEDVWLEKRVMKEYPGSEKNLSAVASAVNGEFKDMKDADKIAKDWMAILPVAITWEGRKDYAGIENTAECQALLDDDLRKRIEGWVKEIEKSKNTADNHKLAKKIYDEVMKEAEKRKPEPEDNKGDGDGQGTPDQDDPHGDETNKGDGDENSREEKGITKSEQLEGEKDKSDEGGDNKGKASSKDEEGGDKGDEQGRPEQSGEDTSGGKETQDKREDKGDQDAVGGGGLWGSHDVQTTDLNKAVENTVGDAHLNDGGGNQYRVLSTAKDKVITRHSGHNSSEASSMNDVDGEEIYQREIGSMIGTPNVIRRKLERALSAHMNRGWDHGRETGRLDSKRLVAAYNCQPNVYKEKEEIPDMDTAFTILIDMSGSMGGSKVHLAQKIVIALAEAVERTQVRYEILGFTTRNGRRYLSPEECQNSWGRIQPLRHYVFKEFNEPLNRAKNSIGNMRYCTGDNNVDGEAILWALHRLNEQPEKRKVMMVLSDGSPTAQQFDMGNLMSRYDHVRYAVDQAIKSGVECIGIGIMDSSVRQYYPDYVVVYDLEELEKTAISKLAKALLGERYEVDNKDLLKVRDAVA